MRNRICILVSLLFLIPIVSATEMQTSVSLNCDDYEINPVTTGIMLLYWCNPVNESLFISPNNPFAGYSSYDIDIIKITHSNSIWYEWSGGAWRNIGSVAEACSGVGNNTCSFYLSRGELASNRCARNASNTYTPIIEFTRYLPCTTPKLNILTPLPNGTIGVGGYLFNFSIDNSIGWSGVSCNLVLNGTTSQYSTAFSSNTTTPFVVAYSLFTRQPATAHVVCTYLNALNNSEQFENRYWTLDGYIQYKIADAGRVIGQVSIVPKVLYSYDKLTNVQFMIVSQSDKTNYGQSITANLTTKNNTASLGCNAFANISFRTLTAPFYSITTSLACPSGVNVTLNLTVFDTLAGAYIDSLIFNVRWLQGHMIIDNVNLVKNQDTDDLELWATVSTDYFKTPIADAANLSCSYNMTSYGNSTVYSGELEVYRTYSESLELIQTDVRNVTVDVDTAYELGSRFSVAINCSAVGYANRTMSGDRWMGYLRLKTLKCLLVMGLPYYQTPVRELYYTATYWTKNASVVCTIVPELTSVNNDADKLVSIGWASDNFIDQFWSLALQTSLQQYFNSQCPGAVYGTTGAFDFLHTYGLDMYARVPFTTTLYKKDASCSMVPLAPGKEWTLVVFAMLADYSAGNYSITQSPITPTTVIVTFDLSYTAGVGSATNYLRIQNNKTTGIGLVEKGDVILCSLIVYDPSLDIVDVKQSIVDGSGNAVCKQPLTTSNDRNNGTWEWSGYVVVSKDTCPAFGSNNSNGTMQCVASVSTYDGITTYVRSNILPFRTDFNPQGPCNAWDLKCRFGTPEGVVDYFTGNSILRGLLQLLTTNPLMFFLLGLIMTTIIVPGGYLIIRVLFSRGG